MSNVQASEENIESPSTYGNEAYKEYRRTKKKDEKKEQGTRWGNQMVLNTLWTIILVIVAIIIIVLLLKFLFALFMIVPTGLHYDIQTLNFVISDLKISW
jgi:hypothetical protein